MKKLALIALLLASAATQAQVVKSAETEVSFFSKSPVEDISALTKKTTAAINLDSRAIAFSVPIKSFVFTNGLMQEHFNENYLESSKYPNASFKGKINENVDLKKDGTYNVTSTGKLNIHGVEQDRTLDGTITVKNGLITLNSAFKVKLVDHRIEVPTLVTKNIAEVIDVKLKAKFNNL
ncbi:MAG: YceI family protein [Bacteroidota bacterium]